MRSSAPRATSAPKSRSIAPSSGTGSMWITVLTVAGAACRSLASWAGVETMATEASALSRMKRICSAIRVG